MNKAMLESYVRNLAGQVIAAAFVVQSATHVQITSFGVHEYLLLANALWGSLVPVALRWVNKNDPAFGRVAEAVADVATAKLNAAAKKK